MNNKVRGNKNTTCLHFLNLLNICRKFEFLISEGSVATCLVDNVVPIFLANLMRFPPVQNF